MSQQDELLTPKQVSELTTISVSTLSFYRQTGKGPPFLRLSPKIIRYKRGEVMAWAEREHITPGETDDNR